MVAELTPQEGDRVIIPRDIVNLLLEDPETRGRFGFVERLRSPHAIQGGELPTGTELEEWMLAEGHKRSPAIGRYVFYLSLMARIYSEVYHFFDTWDPSGTPGHDCLTTGTRIDEILAVARYLYYLDSHGVEGCVLECGGFKGWSSVCLSWACDFLGRRLYVADSFEGLPTPSHRNWSGYREGDFTGTLDEVRNSMYALGRPRSVEFIKGWFNESLRGFDQPIALLWVDVDLYESARDVMTNTLSRLSPRGAIMSHEYDQALADEPFGPATAILEYLDEHGVPYETTPAVPDTLGLIVPNVSGRLLFSSEKHAFWYDRSLSDEDRAARYVLVADQEEVRNRLNEVLNSRTWKMTAPVRRGFEALAKARERLRR